MCKDWTLELQGSEVQYTELNNGQLRLRLSAAMVHQGLGKAVDAGYVKGLELHFDHATVAHGSLELASCLGTLSDCSLHIDSVPQRRLPLPFSATGDVRAELNFRSGSTLLLAAQAVHCTPPPDARFQTSYAC